MDLYTIGHTTQSQEAFLDMVNAFHIDCIIDVRSMPYSKYAIQFNQDVLRKFLSENGVMYAHFGTEFGARRSDCLKETKQKDGSTVLQVNFELGAKTDNLKMGMRRLDKALSQKRTVALMCTESNPLDCHRFSFLSRYLVDNGYEVGHVMRDKSSNEIVCRTHKELEDEMIHEYLSKRNPELLKTEEQLLQEGFFPGFVEACTKEEQRNAAYRLKNRDIGYIPTRPQDDIID